MDRLGATPETTGSLWAAATWLESILEHGSLGAVWPLTDETLREELVADWVDVNARHPTIVARDHESIIEDLSSLLPPRDPQLWRGFEEAQVRDFRAMWGDVDLRSWSWEKEPKPLALDVETIVVLDAGELDDDGRPVTAPPSEGLPGLGFVMRYSDRAWRVMAVTPCLCY